MKVDIEELADKLMEKTGKQEAKRKSPLAKELLSALMFAKLKKKKKLDV